MGMLLLILFSAYLHWLPTGGWGTWRQAVMPVTALSVLPTAYIARVTRAAMLEVLQQDYIRTARAKGLRENVVVLRHVARNGLIPVLTVLGPCRRRPRHRLLHHRVSVCHPGDRPLLRHQHIGA